MWLLLGCRPTHIEDADFGEVTQVSPLFLDVLAVADDDHVLQLAHVEVAGA